MPHDCSSLRHRVLGGEQRGQRERRPLEPSLAASPLARRGNSSGAQRRAERRRRAPRRHSSSALAVDAARSRTAPGPSPAYCAPPPGNMNTTERRARRGCRWRSPRLGSRASSAAAASARSLRHHGAPVREAACARPAACTRRRRGRASGSAAQVAREVARSPLERARGAARDGEQLRRRATAPTARGAGASSRITWALVPPAPSAVTPARRGAPAALVHGAQLGVHEERAVREVDLRVGRLEVEAGRDLAGAASASTVLMRPATPAASPRWPMFVFTEPMRAEPRARRCCRGTPASAPRPRSGRR